MCLTWCTIRRGPCHKVWIGQGVDHQGNPYELTASVVANYYPFTQHGSGLILLDKGDELLPWYDTVRVVGDYFPVHCFDGGSHRFEHMQAALEFIRQHAMD